MHHLCSLVCVDGLTVLPSSDNKMLILLHGAAHFLSHLVFPKYFVNYCLMPSVSTSSETIIPRELWLITVTPPYLCAYAYHLSLTRLEVTIHSLEEWFP